MSTQITLKNYLAQDEVDARIKEVLKNKSQSFLVSITSLASNPSIAECEPKSIVGAALTAAALGLEINNQLGFAHIVPYNDRKTGQKQAQFQVGYKGYIQLAMRSGQFKTITDAPIHEGQLISTNPLTGYQFDFTVTGGKLIGYAAHFSLHNGFEKTLFMTIDELKKHGLAYSQSYKKGYGLWKDNFEAMARKTVLKLLLSKYAPLSVDMQTAILKDQAVIGIDGEYAYLDNQVLTAQEVAANKEAERVKLHIESATSEVELLQAQPYIDTLDANSDLKTLYKNKLQELTLEAA